MLIATASLAGIALLGFAVSLVAFLVQTSRHKPTRGWALATGAFLVLVLLIGTISNAVSRHSGFTLSEGRSTVPTGVGQSDQDATVRVTRVVDGDTIDISPSVEGRSRVRLIGMDTPEVQFSTQPYGPKASAFAQRELDGERVRVELDVQKIDPVGAGIEVAAEACGTPRTGAAVQDDRGLTVGTTAGLPVHEVPVADVEHAVLVRLLLRVKPRHAPTPFGGPGSPSPCPFDEPHVWLTVPGTIAEDFTGRASLVSDVAIAHLYGAATDRQLTSAHAFQTLR